MGKVDTYKTTLGYGLVETFFTVSIIPPTFVTDKYPNFISTEKDNFDWVVRTAKFPKPRDTTKQTVEYMGEFYNYVGERGDYENIEITFTNMKDFYHKNALEFWMANIIQNNQGGSAGTRLEPDAYKASSFKIALLDKNKNAIRTCIVYGAFPTAVNSFDLGYTPEKANQIDTTVTFTVDYYEIVKTSGTTNTSLVI